MMSSPWPTAPSAHVIAWMLPSTSVAVTSPRVLAERGRGLGAEQAAAADLQTLDLRRRDGLRPEEQPGERLGVGERDRLAR